MWVRVLLQPWWVRTTYLALCSVATGLAAIALFRYQDSINPNPLSLPVPGIAIIALACVSLAGLVAAVSEQRCIRYRQALQATGTPPERSQAITAVWRGPVPVNPRVRDAAGQLAWLQLSRYRKNRLAYSIVFPLLALMHLLSAVDSWFDHASHRAVVSAIFAVGLLSTFAWVWFARRRLRARVALLAPTLSQN